MKQKFISLIMIAVMSTGILAGCAGSGAPADEEELTIWGQVTGIDGDQITLTLGTPEQPDQKTTETTDPAELESTSVSQNSSLSLTLLSSQDATQPSDREASPNGKPEGAPPDGSSPGGIAPKGNPPDGSTPGGIKPDGSTPGGIKPDGTTPGNIQPRGAAPGNTTPDGIQSAPPEGSPSGASIRLTPSDEQKTISLSDDTVISIQTGQDTTEGSIDDLTIGSIVCITMKGETVIAIIIMQ